MEELPSKKKIKGHDSHEWSLPQQDTFKKNQKYGSLNSLCLPNALKQNHVVETKYHKFPTH